MHANFSGEEKLPSFLVSAYHQNSGHSIIIFCFCFEFGMANGSEEIPYVPFLQLDLIGNIIIIIARIRTQQYQTFGFFFLNTENYFLRRVQGGIAMWTVVLKLH